MDKKGKKRVFVLVGVGWGMRWGESELNQVFRGHECKAV